MDTPPDKNRKPRSDLGSKRPRETAESKRNPRIASELHTKPKAKRSARTYIVVVGRYETYASLGTACAALGEETAAYIPGLVGVSDDQAQLPPVLIVGRVLKTRYEPARTIPPTVRVVK